MYVEFPLCDQGNASSPSRLIQPVPQIYGVVRHIICRDKANRRSWQRVKQCQCVLPIIEADVFLIAYKPQRATGPASTLGLFIRQQTKFGVRATGVETTAWKGGFLIELKFGFFSLGSLWDQPILIAARIRLVSFEEDYAVEISIACRGFAGQPASVRKVRQWYVPRA